MWKVVRLKMTNVVMGCDSKQKDSLGRKCTNKDCNMKTSALEISLVCHEKDKEEETIWV